MGQDTHLNPRNIHEPKSFPSFSSPKIVGSFSVDGNREYIPDARNCKYLRKKNLNEPLRFDLNVGYENVIHKSEQCQNENLDHILRFIKENAAKLLDGQTRRLDVDFVCFRGLLRLIMCTPYENRDPWIILASKFNGTIYLCAMETERKRHERLNENDTTKRILSYGFKFEQYMLTGKPHRRVYGVHTHFIFIIATR